MATSDLNQIYHSDSGDEISGAHGIFPNAPPPAYSQTVQENLHTLANVAISHNRPGLQQTPTNLRTSPNQSANETMLEFANANAQLLADLQQIHNRSSRAFEQIVTQRVGSMSHDVLADITHQNQTLYQAIDHVNQEVLQQHRHHNDAIIESNMQFQNS